MVPPSVRRKFPMKTKVVIQVITYTDDAEVEKRLILAAEDEDHDKIAELLKYCQHTNLTIRTSKDDKRHISG
jgi:hypothetical protein